MEQWVSPEPAPKAYGLTLPRPHEHSQSRGGTAYSQSRGGTAYSQSGGGTAYSQSRGGTAYSQSGGGTAYGLSLPTPRWHSLESGGAAGQGMASLPRTGAGRLLLRTVGPPPAAVPAARVPTVPSLQPVSIRYRP
jgi:hypothetical protein